MSFLLFLFFFFVFSLPYIGGWYWIRSIGDVVRALCVFLSCCVFSWVVVSAFFTVEFCHVPFLWGGWFCLGLCGVGSRLGGGILYRVVGVA